MSELDRKHCGNNAYVHQPHDWLGMDEAGDKAVKRHCPGTGPVAEPEPVDVLDLVRQYGEECSAARESVLDENQGTADVRRHNHAAGALYRRIEAEVNRLRAEVERLNAEAERVTDDLVKARDERDAQRLRADDAVDSLDRHREAWEAELDRLNAAQSDPSAPLVLSLPTVPDGAVALVGAQRWMRVEVPGITQPCWQSALVGPLDLGAMLDAEPDGVTVVMREPRTWPQFEAEPADLPAVVEVSGHRWVRDGADFYHVSTLMMADRRFNDLRQFGDVVEVFDDDKDSTR